MSDADYARLTKNYTVLKDALSSVPKDPTTTTCITMRFAMMFANPNVQLRQGNILKTAATPGRPAVSKFVNPVMVMQVPACKPNKKFSINTGYVIDIPDRVTGVRITRDMKLERISDASHITMHQPNVVLVPMIECRTPDARIIPTLTANDPSDMSLFFVNFVNVNGAACSLGVYFMSFAVTELNKIAKLVTRDIDDDQTETPQPVDTLLKSKNLKTKKCFIQSFKSPLAFDRMTKLAEGSVEISSADTKNLVLTLQPNSSVLLVPRKRESS